MQKESLLFFAFPSTRNFGEAKVLAKSKRRERRATKKREKRKRKACFCMFENRPLSADDLQNSIIPVGDKGHIEIRPLTTDELPPETLEAFLAVGFTNHYEILAQKKDVEQRLFYIVNCATGFWNGDKLKYYMKDDLFGKRGNMRRDGPCVCPRGKIACGRTQGPSLPNVRMNPTERTSVSWILKYRATLPANNANVI